MKKRPPDCHCKCGCIWPYDRRGEKCEHCERIISMAETLDRIADALERIAAALEKPEPWVRFMDDEEFGMMDGVECNSCGHDSGFHRSLPDAGGHCSAPGCQCKVGRETILLVNSELRGVTG